MLMRRMVPARGLLRVQTLGASHALKRSTLVSSFMTSATLLDQYDHVTESKLKFLEQARSKAADWKSAVFYAEPAPASDAGAKSPPSYAIRLRKLNSDADGQPTTFDSKYNDRTPRLPNMWLRDHCQCSKCTHPDTRQREVSLFSVPPTVEITKYSYTDDGISVTWSDGHQSHYTRDWLARVIQLRDISMQQERPDKKIHWNSRDLAPKDYPEVPFADIMGSDTGVKEWTLKLRQYGFCFVADCPTTPEASKSLLERLGPIRNTHYGAFYDFTADLSSKDTAYTNIALGLHTDTTYFSEPAGLQMFHMLSHSEGSGGASLLADGFKAAKLLKEESEDMYSTLRRHRLWYHASGNDGISIVPSRSLPTLVHHGRDDDLQQVRWNNYDRAALDVDIIDGTSDIDKWYAAARRFDAIINENAIEVQMTPGRPLIFDNWRVLHGRTAFTGKRRVCGGYVNRDDFISRFKMTNLGAEQVLQSPVV